MARYETEAFRPLTEEEEEQKKKYPSLYTTITMRGPKMSDEELKENAKISSNRYREQNKEKLRIQKKIYDDKHKEERKIYSKEHRIKIADKLNEVIKCECGGKSIYGNLHHHKKTKRHMTYLKYQEDLLKK